MLNTTHVQDAAALLNRPADGQPNRRTALQAAAVVGLGYAAATQPVMAQTAIQTSAEGLTVGEVTIDVNGFKMPAYRAQPAGKANVPVVLVISEIFGVHEYIADVCRRLAREGYMAIAPELFVRQGDAQSYGEMAKLMSEVIAKVPDAQVKGDLDACVAWAAANGGDTNKVAITGFCWGGRQTWLYTAANPKIKAGVAWYGRLEGAVSDLTPKHPIDVVNGLNGPVLGLYGAADTGIPLTSVDKMKVALAASGNANAKASTFVVYPDAPHAFHADYRPSFRAEPAQDGWKRMLAWFAQNGVK